MFRPENKQTIADLESALVEYIEKYGLTEKARATFVREPKLQLAETARSRQIEKGSKPKFSTWSDESLASTTSCSEELDSNLCF